uniref:SFRICE_033390 n=1 Tax=Spodoptera frugiperda TaxID=7108 RepID=A0A2H1VSH5_SPOFR
MLLRYYFTSDPPQLRMGAMVIYYACIIHINLPLESLYLLQKTASKSVAHPSSHKTLNIRDIHPSISLRTNHTLVQTSREH